ncbi:hypothetical protein Hanom_Chr16g01494421 [Helianthus anomalus]
MVLAGLISSSENNGSRTDTGLGLPVLSSEVFSTSSLFLLLEGEDREGDTTGEQDNSSSSVESYRPKKNYQF